MALSQVVGSREVRIGLAVAVLVLIAVVVGRVLVGQARAEPPPYNRDESRVAIKGYDPVAYFLESRPMRGDERYAYAWQDAEWHFASAANRDLFEANPQRYAPRFGGYCAMGIALGQYADIDPQAWTIVEGKLYLNKSVAVRDTAWRPDTERHIAQAERNWYEKRAELTDAR